MVMIPQIQVSRSLLEGSPAFHYFCLVYVDGFDPTKHCKACFLGVQSWKVHLRRLTPRVWHTLNESPRSKFLYLCASTGTYQTNIHVAMKRDPKASPIV